MENSFLNTFPPITRYYLIISFFANLFCFLRFMKPSTLAVNFELIIYRLNFWRLFSHAFFFGQPGVKTIFYIFFFVRYSKALEHNSFHERKADYLYLLLSGNSMMLLLKIFVPEAHFLGAGITNMIVYLWGKKNAQQHINLINIAHIRGSTLPLVLILTSLFLKQKNLKLEIMGLIAGHVYYYLEEIYPRLTGGRKPLSTPNFLKEIFEIKKNINN